VNAGGEGISGGRSGNGLRVLGEPFVVAAPTGARIRTSLHVSPADHEVLWQVGCHLGSLAGRDLAARCALGRGGKHAGRAERKKSLTGESSSRWAGAITRWSGDQWERGYKNLVDDAVGLRRAIDRIEARLAAPVGGRRGQVKGYASQAERWQKQCRVPHLECRLREVNDRIESGRVSVVRGGRARLHARHHLDDAGLSEVQWRQEWTAARLFLSADGEADKTWGNETIRVHPEAGWLELRLPTPLKHLSNTAGRACTYRLSCPVGFNHRGDEWAAQTVSGAVRYDITYNPAKRRWYLDASWQTNPTPPPSLEALRGQRTLGVDLNDGHLAGWVLDPAGNPVGRSVTIPMVLDGSTERRDGQLRQAITALLDVAQRHGCASVSIENLDFVDARQVGRETMGGGRRGRRFRKTVAGIPTARFRTRLVGMAHNRGLAVVSVDPAYTSRWGAQHWQAPLTVSHTKTTSADQPSRHHAAAVVIARRSQGHSAKRRTRTPNPHQRTRQRQRVVQAHPDPNAARPPDPGQPPVHHPPVGKTRTPANRTGLRRRARNRPGASQRPSPKTDRR
jgi:hypothetical protein